MDIGNPLVRLLSSASFREAHWDASPAVFRQAVPPTMFPDERFLLNTLKRGLLRWPYFTLLQEGQQPPVKSFTTVRTVRGKQLTGFPDPAKVGQLLGRGATVKFTGIEEWHRPTRKLLRDVEAIFPGEAMSFMFYTPDEKSGLRAHSDGAHVVAVQVSGTKEWRLYGDFDKYESEAGVVEGVGAPTKVFVLEPGDVLYLPHGAVHMASATAGASLHATFTITEPTPADLAEAVLGTSAEELHRLAPALTVNGEARLDRTVRAAMLQHLQSLDSAALVDEATTIMRRRNESSRPNTGARVGEGPRNEGRRLDDRSMPRDMSAQCANMLCAVVPSVIGETEILDAFDCGLLVRPYFDVVGVEGAHPVTRTRVVLGRRMPGYADGSAVRDALTNGHPVELVQPEDWNESISQVVTKVAEAVGTTVVSSVYLVPLGAFQLPVEADGCTLVAVQISGCSIWSMPAALDAGDAQLERRLHSGDMLYLLAAERAQVSASGGSALFLVVKYRRRTAGELGSRMIMDLIDGEALTALSQNHHRLRPLEKAARVKAELARHLAEGQPLVDLPHI